MARALATFDRLSEGRAAWNIVTSFQQAEARNFGLEDHLSKDVGYDRADEFMEVACKLWNSRDPDALKILPGITPITGETREIALAKDGLLTGLSEARAGLSTLAYHLDIEAALPWLNVEYGVSALAA